MPRVPQYGQLKVASSPVPGVRKGSSASTFESEGGAVALARGQIGETIARVGIQGFAAIQQQERERADQLGNLQTLQKFNELDHKYLYDQEHGFLNKKGIEPHEQSAKYVGDYDLDAAAIGADVKTAKQQEYYEQLRANRLDSFRQRVDQHSSQQYDAYEQQQFQATIESSINSAVNAGAGDLATVRLQLQQQDEAIANHGARLGMSPEAQQLFRDKTRAAVHSGIVENLLDQNKTNAAKAYFEETKDAIAKGDPNAVAHIEKAINEGVVLQQAQKKSDQILATTSTLTEARDAAKAIEDPKVRQQTMELVEHELAVREHQKDEEHKATTLKGLNIVEKTGTWTSIPAHEWATYTVGERESIKEFLRQKAAGTAVKTDPNVYAAIIAAAHSENPQDRADFQRLNPLTLVDKLSPSDFQEVVRLQESSRKGENDLAADAANQGRMVNEALVGMGLPDTPVEPGKDKYDAIAYERVAGFRRAVREAIGRLEADKGKKATDVEVQSIVDTLRTRVAIGGRVVKSGTFVNTYGDAYAFEVKQAQITDAADIPPAERRHIDDALRATGQPVDDVHRIKLFNVNLARVRKDR